MPAGSPAFSWRALLPLGLFAGLALFLGLGLSLNPRELPSALIDKPLPVFDLPALEADGVRLNAAELADGRVTVLNVFASWCGPCRQEMPTLAVLAHDADVRMAGLVYKDKSADTRRFLKDYGNPFAILGVDADGRAGIDLGVYGVPETYVIDGRGVIAYKHVGPITPESLAAKLKPAIEAARARTAAPKGGA